MTDHRITRYAEAEAGLKIPDLHQALYDADPIFLPRTVVCLHGEEHIRKKRTVMSVFTRRFFRHYQNHVYPEGLKETLAPAVADGGGDMVRFAYRVLVNLVSDTAGLDRDRTPEETDRIQALIGKLGHAPTMGQMIGGDRDKLLGEIREALAEFERDFYEPSVARRKALIAKVEAGEADEADLPNDVITAMLRAYPEGTLDHDERVKDAAFFILAGAFTTANVLMNTMHEILGWLDRHPDDRAKLVNDPALLQKFVMEAIRLHPASPISRRRALSDLDLPDGHTLPEGAFLAMDLKEANRDPEVFGPDAAEFNPHRELPDRVPLHGLSFGGGMHSCLGRMLAAGVPAAKDGSQAQSGETEWGTIHMVARELLALGMARDPDRPAEIDESTTRKHFRTFPFVFDPALAVTEAPVEA
ncbi:cytochrome P450 [Rhodobacterales bacterium HKCCE2091]|nr:cytochrome P450 [Rhodobacterales bacterium HKCCE2091]